MGRCPARKGDPGARQKRPVGRSGTVRGGARLGRYTRLRPGVARAAGAAGRGGSGGGGAAGAAAAERRGRRRRGGGGGGAAAGAMTARGAAAAGNSEAQVGDLGFGVES